MNAYEIAGLTHIFAMSVSMISFVGIVILKKQKIISFTSENIKILMLAAFDMIISMLYFLIDYYSTITGASGVNGIARVMDAWLTVSMQYIWFMLVNELIFGNEKNAFRKLMRIIYPMLLIINLVNYGFIMDEYYYVENKSLRMISMSLEAGEMIVTAIINITLIYTYMYRYKKMKKQISLNKFVLAGSAVILFETCQGAFVGIRLMSGLMVLHEYKPDILNITPILRLVFACILLWYVAKYCILAQYQKKPVDVIKDGKTLDIGFYIEQLAADKALTERETIIAKLLYEGSTYKDIADYLYISVNTVKHHVTSIYRKMEVSSKMEMINIIRARREDA